MPTLVRRKASGSPALDPRQVRTLGNLMLAELGLPQAELSVLLADDAFIKSLNREHRQKDRATDVLAFALDEVSELEVERMLGDVVISLDTAARQAKGRKRPLLAEVRFLLAHGLLHLCGYDHATPAGKHEMDRLTRRLVRAAGGPGGVGSKKKRALNGPAKSPTRR